MRFVNTRFQRNTSAEQYWPSYSEVSAICSSLAIGLLVTFHRTCPSARIIGPVQVFTSPSNASKVRSKPMMKSRVCCGFVLLLVLGWTSVCCAAKWSTKIPVKPYRTIAVTGADTQATLKKSDSSYIMNKGSVSPQFMVSDKQLGLFNDKLKLELFLKRKSFQGITLSGNRSEATQAFPESIGIKKDMVNLAISGQEAKLVLAKVQCKTLLLNITGQLASCWISNLDCSETINVILTGEESNSTVFIYNAAGQVTVTLTGEDAAVYVNKCSGDNPIKGLATGTNAWVYYNIDSCKCEVKDNAGASRCKPITTPRLISKATTLLPKAVSIINSVEL